MPAIAPKQKKETQTAFFRVSPSQGATIEKEDGIIRGVKIAEVGKLATFAGPDGKPRQITISPEWISALLAHAGNRSLPIHFTHEWHESTGKPDADSVELNARVGALKSFRRDGEGNAVADAFLYDTGKRTAILSSAEHNPEDLMFSAVFNYDKNDPLAMPLNFRAADIVPQGAATTALFSETQPESKTMDINELVEALKDPKVQAAVTAIIKSHKADAPDEPDAKMENDATAEMEKDAGVEDGDKKKEDENKPALFRRLAPIVRALSRKFTAVSVNETALLAKVDVKLKASETALLGKGGFQSSGGEVASKETPESFIAALLANGKATNRGHAIALMARQNPELYHAHTSR